MPIADPERRKAARKAWKKANPEKVREQKRRTKIRKKARRGLPVSARPYGIKPLRLAPSVEELEQKRAYAREHARMRAAANREYVLQYKLSHPCPCGESHPACLDFHHRDPADKRAKVSVAVGTGRALEFIIAEIAKCDVICANCHRKLHWAEEQGAGVAA